MNLARLFDKYHVALMFPSGVIDDGERKLDCSEAEHLFSCTKNVTTGTIYFYDTTRVQIDYFKSKKGNIVAVTRSLLRNSDALPEIEVISQAKFDSDYKLAYLFRNNKGSSIIYDAYNKKPALEEV